MKNRVHMSLFILCLIGAYIFAGIELNAAKVTVKNPFEKPYSIEPFYDPSLSDKDENYALYYPNHMAIDSSGNVYVADCGNHRILKFSPDGKFIKKWGSFGSGPGSFHFRQLGGAYLYIDKNDYVYVLGKLLHRIQVFDGDGNYIKGLKLEQFKSWLSFSVDSGGNIYLSSFAGYKTNDTIFKYAPYKNGYRFSKSFGRQPFSKVDFANYVSTKKGFFRMMATHTFLFHNEKDELYQLFLNYPLIKKYSPAGRLLWQKQYAPSRVFSKISHPGVKKLEKFPPPSSVTQEWHEDDDNFYPFIDDCSVDYVNRRLLLKMYHNSEIVALDYNGNILGAYYPFDVYNGDVPNTEEPNNGSMDVPRMLMFQYNNATGEGVFLHSRLYLMYRGNLSH